MIGTVLHDVATWRGWWLVAMWALAWACQGAPTRWAIAEEPPQEEVAFDERLADLRGRLERWSLEHAVASQPGLGAWTLLGRGRGVRFHVRRYSQRHASAGTGPRLRQDATEWALRWFAAQQAPDGCWDPAEPGRWCNGTENLSARPDGAGQGGRTVGATGLALCTYLAAGYTHRGDHPYIRTIYRGLSYLRDAQDREGCIGPRSATGYLRQHALATLALVETYALTGSTLWKRAAQQGLDFLAASRRPEGAWGDGRPSPEADPITTLWATLALWNARLVIGEELRSATPVTLRVEGAAWNGVRAWLEQATDPGTGRVRAPRLGTMDSSPGDPPASGASLDSATAIGVLLRALLGEDPAQGVLRQGALLLRTHPPRWDPSGQGVDLELWHAGLLAAFQLGGETQDVWEAFVRAQITRHQREDGSACDVRGSWDPLGPGGAAGGRVESTALLALCCQTIWRYDRVGATR